MGRPHVAGRRREQPWTVRAPADRAALARCLVLVCLPVCLPCRCSQPELAGCAPGRQAGNADVGTLTSLPPPPLPRPRCPVRSPPPARASSRALSAGMAMFLGGASSRPLSPGESRCAQLKRACREVVERRQAWDSTPAVHSVHPDPDPASPLRPLQTAKMQHCNESRATLNPHPPRSVSTVTKYRGSVLGNFTTLATIEETSPMCAHDPSAARAPSQPALHTRLHQPVPHPPSSAPTQPRMHPPSRPPNQPRRHQGCQAHPSYWLRQEDRGHRHRGGTHRWRRAARCAGLWQGGPPAMHGRTRSPCLRTRCGRAASGRGPVFSGRPPRMRVPTHPCCGCCCVPARSQPRRTCLTRNVTPTRSCCAPATPAWASWPRTPAV